MERSPQQSEGRPAHGPRRIGHGKMALAGSKVLGRAAAGHLLDGRRLIRCAVVPPAERGAEPAVNSWAVSLRRVGGLNGFEGRGTLLLSQLAIGETVILLRPSLPLVGVSTAMER